MRLAGILFLIVVHSTITCAQKQGIKGQVFWLSGNQMPGPGAHRPAQKGTENRTKAKKK